MNVDPAGSAGFFVLEDHIGLLAHSQGAANQLPPDRARRVCMTRPDVTGPVNPCIGPGDSGNRRRENRDKNC